MLGMALVRALVAVAFKTLVMITVHGIVLSNILTHVCIIYIYRYIWVGDYHNFDSESKFSREFQGRKIEARYHIIKVMKATEIQGT